MLRFLEKNGKSREIHVRHDLEALIFAHLDTARLLDVPKETPLFQSAVRRRTSSPASPFTPTTSAV